MKIPILLAAFVALPLLPSLAAEPLQLPAKKDFHLFLLAGQSNMAGRGKLDDEARQPQPRVFSLNKEGQWQPAADPLHWDKSAAGTGIGKPFGEIINPLCGPYTKCAVANFPWCTAPTMDVARKSVKRTVL